MCAELDKHVERFRTRKLESPYPYVWLDGTFVKVRENGRVVSQALVIAIAVTISGEREVLGLDVGPSESGAFWLSFLRDLTARGLNGVKLVISDAHGVTEGGDQQRAARCKLATLPRALYARCARPRTKECAAYGRRHHPDRLCAARCSGCA